MKVIRFVLFEILISVLLVFAGCNHRQVPLELSKAQELFTSVDSLCREDNGKLWGKSLYGPIMLVNPQNRKIVANLPDREGKLTMVNGVFTGQLPEEMNIANTATSWGGVNWAMVSWDALQNEQKNANQRLLIHESWHREQETLGVEAVMSKNLHLDEEQGVILMKLELVALKNALHFDGNFSTDIKNALFIRKYRQFCFPENNEDMFERHEGMAEYTGLKLCGTDSLMIADELISNIDVAIKKEGYSNSFAYFTGPAYGFIFDKVFPNWLTQVKGGKSLTEIAEKVFNVEFQEVDSLLLLEQFNSIVKYYNAEKLIISVKEAAERNRQLAKHYEQKMFGRYQLVIPNQNVQFSFNPQEKLIPIRNGVVYKTLRISAEWGTLEASDGVYRANDWSLFLVSAPDKFNSSNGNEYEWDGYKLTLHQNYTIVELEQGKFGISKR